MRGNNTYITRIKERLCILWERVNLFWLLYRKALFAVTFVFSLVLVPFHQAYAFPPLLLLLGGGIGAAGIAAYLSDIVFNKLFAVLAGFLLWIAELAAGLMTLAGLLFDVSIDYTIIQNPLRNLPAIELSWAVLRDIANMFFIFILLAIAIATILGIERYGAKQLLAKLIIVALLINFSLFFTKIVFDVSNLLASGFYKELTIDSTNVARITGTVPKPSSGTITASNRGSISFTIFNSLLLQDAFKTDTVRTLITNTAGPKDSANVNGRIASFSLVMAFLFLVMAWIFFKLALVFVVRIGLFIFLMILSPLAFLAAILPGTQEYFKKWIHILLAQAFVAPLALLFLFTTIILIQGGVTGNTGFVINAITKPDLDVSDLLKFLIITILLILSYRVTAMVSGQFATAIVNGFSGRVFGLGKIVGGLTLGGAGLVARATLARGAFHADKALKRTKFFGGTRFGGALLKGTTGAVANTKFGSRSFKEVADQLDKEKRERSAAVGDVERRKGADRKIADNYQGTKDEQDEARRKDSDLMGKMNLRQLEALGAKRLVALSSENHLGVEQLESIQKSEKLSEGQIGEIVTARFNKTNTALRAFKNNKKDGDAQRNLQKEVRQLSDKELALWGEGALRDNDVIEALAQKQITDLKKLGKLSGGLKGYISKIRDDILEGVLKGGDKTKIEETLKEFTPQNFADIKDDFYKKYSDTLTKYTAPSVLIEIGKKKNIGVRDAIRESIKDANERGTASDAQIKAQEWFEKPHTPSGMIF